MIVLRRLKKLFIVIYHNNIMRSYYFRHMYDNVSSIICSYLVHLLKLNLDKQKKIHSKKSYNIFLFYGKWNFLALILGNVLYFRKQSPQPPAPTTPKNNIKIKEFLISQEMELSYISGSNFPSSKKKKSENTC